MKTVSEQSLQNEKYFRFIFGCKCMYLLFIQCKYLCSYQTVVLIWCLKLKKWVKTAHCKCQKILQPTEKVLEKIEATISSNYVLSF